MPDISPQQSYRDRHKQPQYKFNTFSIKITLSQQAANKPLFYDWKEQFPSVSEKKNAAKED